MGVGWNLGNSLEAMGPGNEEAWGGPRITQEIISTVASFGFKTIRIPVAWSVFTDDAYTIDQAWLNRVEEVVNYALNENMYVVMNEHWDGGWLNQPFYDQQAALNNRLGTMWEQIATHFRDYDHRLIFAGTNEVMNEGDYVNPPTQEMIDVQNSFNQTFVSTVRATGGNNADRFLVVQSFNTVVNYAIDHFVTPNDTVNDKLFMEVHYYDPWNFTLNPSGPTLEWPSTTETWANEDWMEYQMGRLKTNFVDQGIGVILGEYGVITRVGVPESYYESRNRWNNYLTATALENGIVPIYWDNGDTIQSNNSLGIFNRRTLELVYPELLEALVNSEK